MCAQALKDALRFSHPDCENRLCDQGLISKSGSFTLCAFLYCLHWCNLFVVTVRTSEKKWVAPGKMSPVVSRKWSVEMELHETFVSRTFGFSANPGSEDVSWI
jgi:hypothetical protein